MSTFKTGSIAAIVGGGLFLLSAQQQSPPPANDPSTQKNQDVPNQEPGTNNPDLAKGRKQTPKRRSKGTKETDTTSTRQAKQKTGDPKK